MITDCPGILIDVDHHASTQTTVEDINGRCHPNAMKPDHLTLNARGQVSYDTPELAFTCSRSVFTFIAKRGARLYKANPGWLGRLILFDRRDPRRRVFIPHAVFWLTVETGFTLFSGYDAGVAMVAYR